MGSSDELSQLIVRLALWALPMLAAVIFHEVAHGFVALRLGDDTAKRMGRLTLNPLPHIDPIGTVLLPALLVFVGGPVQPDAAVCVASATIDVDGFTPAFARLGTFDLSKPPDGATGLDRIRVFAGYAGWDEGQLEDEIEQGAWYVLDADPEDAFTTVPDDLWRFVLRRQGGDLSLVANFPIDPSMN